MPATVQPCNHGAEQSICRFVIVDRGAANLRLGFVDGHGKWHLVRIGAALAAFHGCEQNGPRAASFVRSRTDSQHRRVYGLAGELGRRRSQRLRWSHHLAVMRWVRSFQVPTLMANSRRTA